MLRSSILLTGLIFLASFSGFAQTPEMFNYQGVARDNGGNILANQNISLLLKILSGSGGGSIEYSESQSATTNDLGLFNIKIGDGTLVSGSFPGIDWGGDSHFLKVEMDPNGGTNYSLAGTSQLLSVPYALHSETAETVTNDLVDDADADPQNEIQSLSILGQSLSISGSNSVTLPASDGWSLGGNSGTSASTDFLGTSDNTDLVLGTNSTEWFRLQSVTGYIGTFNQLNPYTSFVVGNGNVTNDFIYDGAAEEAIVLAPNSGGAGLMLSSQAVNRVGLDATLAPSNRKIMTMEHTTDLSTDSWISFNSLNDNGTTNQANILSLTHANGNVSIGGVDNNTFSNHVLNIFNGSNVGAPNPNSIQLWAQDIAGSSELRVQDEAGNITVLSPHNFKVIPDGACEPMAWSYYSENHQEGLAINVDMLKAVRLIERLSGEKLVYEAELENQLEDFTWSHSKLLSNYADQEGEVDKLQGEVQDLKKVIQDLQARIQQLEK